MKNWEVSTATFLPAFRNMCGGVWDVGGGINKELIMLYLEAS